MRIPVATILSAFLLANTAGAGCLDGTWRWLGDSGGTKPKTGAVVLIRFFGTTAEFVADQPGQHVESSGTYGCNGDRVTLSFPDLEGGADARNAPFSLHGDQLLLPFALMSGEKGTSQWRKLKGAVTTRIETADCPRKDEHGVPIMMCIKGLVGKSAGNQCLFSVTYLDDIPVDRSLGCALSCLNPALSPERQWACDAPDHTCYAGLSGQVVYRNAAALPEGSRGDLLRAASEIIETLRSNPGIPGDGRPIAGADLAAANRILSAKQAIVDITLAEMIPYSATCTPKRKELRWEYPRKYSAVPQVEASGEVPMQIYAPLKRFEIYGAAFYERRDERTRIARPPDELPALLIHELVHMRQENFGYGDGADRRLVPEQILNEIMAYDVASKTPFYRFALSASQRHDLVETGLEAQIAIFKKVWPSLASDVREGVAKWAWSVDIWMRSRMLLQPTQHGGVWNLLCAANEGGTLCGMSEGPGRPKRK